MVETQKRPVVPGDGEIRTLIEAIVESARQGGNGYFYAADVKKGLIEAGFSANSHVWKRA